MAASPDNGRDGEFVHACVTVRSEARAQRVFAELFAMPLLRRFEVGAELCDALFGIAGAAEVAVYDAGGAAMEVFICPELPDRGAHYDHVCVAVEDRAGTLRRAAHLGLEVRRFRKGAKDVVIVRDEDGNQYEIKQHPPA